jgi:hypothetical protein
VLSDTRTASARRLTQVFRYLEALNQHRNPAIRHLEDQLWRLWFRELPEHPSIRKRAVGDENDPSSRESSTGGEPKGVPDFVLRVRRPKLTPCPAPPDQLVSWLQKDWGEPTPEFKLRPSRNELDRDGKTITVRFEDDPNRVKMLERWRSQRDAWLDAEKPAREAMRIFEQLYEIRGQIEREGEKVELVLGDGILSWLRSEGGVYHPILLQRLQLEFNPTVPEFLLVETERPVELYSALFQSMPDVEGKVLARVRQELEAGKFHPLGQEGTSGLLRSVVVQLSPRGEFFPDSAPKSKNDDPIIGRSPVILLRKRTLGFAVAIQSVLESLSSVEEIPPSLLRIVGIEDAPAMPNESENASSWLNDCHPTDVLLSKPANPEQIRIAQRLEQHGSVLVQGPPGTGKTHTIANLIGHLLAEGKSILVTSHTSKALRVVRDQVVPQLQALCVSVLDSDVESRKQLETSVDEIVSRLSRNDAQQLARVAEELQFKRHALIVQYRQLAEAILSARTDEYRDLVVAGEAFTPSEAARRVHDGRGKIDYIPGPVELGSTLPLSLNEISDLYSTNESVSSADEAELCGVLPNVRNIPTPEEFEALVREAKSLTTQDIDYRVDLWESKAELAHLDAIDVLSVKLRRASELINECQAWQLAAMLSGRYGGDHTKPWESLLAQIDETCKVVSTFQDGVIEYDPQLPEDLPLEEATAVSREIATHTEQGGSLSFFALATRSSWKRFVRGSRVGNIEPKLPAHFSALHGLAVIKWRRAQLVTRWTRQMVPLGAPSPDTLGAAPELAIRQFAASIRRALDWHSSEWEPLQSEAVGLGLRFTQLLDEQPTDVIGGELKRLCALLTGPLQRVLASRGSLIRLKSIENRLRELKQAVESGGGDTQATHVVERLRCAITELNPSLYKSAVARLSELVERRKNLERRRELLGVRPRNLVERGSIRRCRPSPRT